MSKEKHTIMMKYLYFFLNSILSFAAGVLFSDTTTLVDLYEQYFESGSNSVSQTPEILAKLDQIESSIVDLKTTQNAVPSQGSVSSSFHIPWKEILAVTAIITAVGAVVGLLSSSSSQDSLVHLIDANFQGSADHVASVAQTLNEGLCSQNVALQHAISSNISSLAGTMTTQNMELAQTMATENNAMMEFFSNGIVSEIARLIRGYASNQSTLINATRSVETGKSLQDFFE